MKRIIALLMSLCVLLGLSACRKEEKEPDISGYYVLQSGQLGDQALTDSQLVRRGQELFLLLNDDRTAVFYNGDAVVQSTYGRGVLTLDDDTVMAYEVDEVNLTLRTAEGELLFKLSNSAAPDLVELAERLAMPDEVGYYLLKSFTVDGEQQSDMDGWFLALYDDGSGFISNGEKLHDLKWGDGKLISDDDEETDYALSGDTVSVTSGESVMTFVRSGDPLPDKETLQKEFTYKAAGRYELIEAWSGSMSLDTFIEAGNSYLLLNDDGTGELCILGRTSELTWDEDSINYNDDDLDYDYEDDTLTFEEDSVEFIFAREGAKPSGGDSIVGEYYLLCYDDGTGENYDQDADLELYKDGTGSFITDSRSIDITWDSEYVTIASVKYTYELDEDHWLYLYGDDGTYTFVYYD